MTANASEMSEISCVVAIATDTVIKMFKNKMFYQSYKY